MKRATAKLEAVAVIGLGLVGGSLARALKKSSRKLALLGVDREEALGAPRKSGLFDALATPKDAPKLLGKAGVVMLCAPHSENIKWLPRLKKAAGTNVVISDVGGIKRDICERGAEIFNAAAGPVFIGGHPMAGSELSGFENSRDDLFAGRPWALTPVGRLHPSRLGTLCRLVGLVGATPRVMTPASHDEAVVTVSHLPQLVSIALMLAAKGRDRGLAGPGLMGMTRLASSSPAVWDPLLAAERKRSIAELQRLRAYLTELEMSLAFDEPLKRWFDLAAKARREMERP